MVDIVKENTSKEGDNSWLQVLGLLKLSRLLRLNKTIAFLNAKEEIKAGLRIFKMVLFLVIYLHVWACVWWVLVRDDKIWIPSYYMNTNEDQRYDIYNKDTTLMRKYLINFFNSL